MDTKLKLTDLTQTDIHEVKKSMPNMEMFLDNVLAMDTRRDKKPLEILRLDLWHFKSVNDEFMACFPGDADLAGKIAASVAAAFATFDTKPIGIPHGIGCYIGGVIATGDAATLRHRMSDTHEALEESRKKGRNAYTIL